MLIINADVHVHLDGLSASQMEELKSHLTNLKGIIMATKEELTATLSAQADQAEKVKAEIIAAIDELKATATTPEQDALLARIGAALGGLDDIVPDPAPA